jgi:hypothetical protein
MVIEQVEELRGHSILTLTPTPHKNGMVEKKNRTLIDMVRTMVEEYKTLDRFLVEALNTTCYAINKLYLHPIHKKTS